MTACAPPMHGPPRMAHQSAVACHDPLDTVPAALGVHVATGCGGWGTVIATRLGRGCHKATARTVTGTDGGLSTSVNSHMMLVRPMSSSPGLWAPKSLTNMPQGAVLPGPSTARARG